MYQWYSPIHLLSIPIEDSNYKHRHYYWFALTNWAHLDYYLSYTDYYIGKMPHTLYHVPVCHQCISPLAQLAERVTINHEAVGFDPNMERSHYSNYRSLQRSPLFKHTPTLGKNHLYQPSFYDRPNASVSDTNYWTIVEIKMCVVKGCQSPAAR